ncbi:serine/threonine protein kinase [Candidatus Uhrbacteria bacterium]|nr:serine/threonine protein kinase [Candidatus Uhrbacteria bacterium]
MIITSPTGTEYMVGDLVGQTATYRLYLCTQVGTGRQCLLQVAKETTHNGDLDRTAYILRELRAKADELERQYESRRRFPDERLNYHFGFPEAVESFVVKEQGGRRINVLVFPCVDNVIQLVPLYNIIYKDHKRVNTRTSAWIMGKILKILVFAHDQEFQVNNLEPSNILIEPDLHFVVVFDWSDARSSPHGMEADLTRADIMKAAHAVITLLGGDATMRSFPEDGVENASVYLDHLLQLAAGRQSSAAHAHKEFYQLLKNSLHWKGFHPFTTLNR